MKLSNEAGFTIIETMLFLGITGLLVMGVLIGTGTSINAQRYRDSVSSLQAVLQQQYSDVANVSNDTLNNTCYGDATPTNHLRGQSDCVVLGRFITTNNIGCFGININNVCNLSIKIVLGFTPPGSVASLDDVSIFKKNTTPTPTGYNIMVLPDSPTNTMNTTYGLEWGASIVDTHNNAKVFSMLILRSPISGTLRTFISPDTSSVVADHDVQTLLTVAALTINEVNVCISSNGLFTGSRSAVIVKPNTTDASGVETKENGSGC